jgi:processive 1,2-diacylglycerol beta-glucosyltransferase
MKILVVHATAGAGHKKAAEAIYHGLIEAGHEASLVDALDYTNPFFKATYPTTYTFLVTKLPWAWKFFFGILDIPALQPAVHFVRRLYNGFNAGALQKFLKQEQFDCIITTQFLSAEVSAYLKRTGQIKSKVICVVTDFDVHRIWVNQGIDTYAGASDYTREKLISLGVDPSRAFVTGIPTDKPFNQPVDVNALKQKLGLRTGKFTILIATGSFGMGPIEELIEKLKDYQLLVVCGHNKNLYDRLNARASGDVHILPLVHNMHELMSVSDVMITKPGGLSIAEALVKHLPMLFFSAIPGQEMQNIFVLKKYGAAQDQMSIEEISRTIDAWQKTPQEFETLRRNLTALAKPSAVAEIVKLCPSAP